MGIITILWEKWVEFRRDFYKITLAAMIAPLMYLVVFGMGIQTTSHGPDPRCRISDDYERKFQCDRPEPERTKTVRKSIRPGLDLTNSSVAVYRRTDHRRKSPWILCRRCDPDSDSADRHRTDLQWMVQAAGLFLSLKKTTPMYRVFPTTSSCRWLIFATPSFPLRSFLALSESL